MKQYWDFLRILTVGLAIVTGCDAQSASNSKSHIFRGQVTAVNKADKSLTVNGEKVEGWMGAMTMDYKVDDPSILNSVKPGDRITATVYDGDYSLHKVRVVGNGAAKPAR
jgi:Cu/Ag efflux protein CusF